MARAVVALEVAPVAFGGNVNASTGHPGKPLLGWV